MSTDRFNPDPAKPYATCSDCGAVLQTAADGSEHMDSTMQPVTDLARPSVRASGHSIRVTNQTREGRIGSWIADTERQSVDDAVEEILDAIDDGHLTQEEALAAYYRNDLVRDDLEEALR